MRKVVVTGIGVLSPLGIGFLKTLDAIKANKSGVEYIKEWDQYEGLRTRLGASIKGLDFSSKFNVKQLRTLNKASVLSALATDEALAQASLVEDAIIQSGRVGIAYGSGISSPQALSEMCNFIFNKTTKGITSSTYHRMMSHTVASNLSILYGIRGRFLPTSSACTSGSLAVGYGYELIKEGKQDIMICGGAEEFHPAITSIFDILYACSLNNDDPLSSPRPFDIKRDGLVVGEGACTVILEAEEHARARGVMPIAEVSGFGTNCDGYHITNPYKDTIESCMRLALADSKLRPQDIGYVNAHATATQVGDIVESQAVLSIFGENILISSLKGHMGHLLGASGAVEIALTIGMMKEGWLAPTRNLKERDPKCANLEYIVDKPLEHKVSCAMSNTFAFGGVNTSLIFIDRM